MRLSELAGKKVVNLRDGEILGDVGDADLVIDEKNGDIVSMLLPVRGNVINWWFDKSYMTIPWEAVKRIGTEIIVVELDESHSPLW